MKFIFREMGTGMVIRCFAIKVKGAIRGEGAFRRSYITAGNTACVFMMVCLAILCLCLIRLAL